MRNKKRFVKSFLTKTMLWAAFATLNYNPAIAAEYTINNFSDLSSALKGGTFGDNSDQLQNSDNVILGGLINADSSIEVAIKDVTINGGGDNSYVYSTTGNSINGLITGVGTNIENINMQGFDNAIVVNSGNTLNFSNSLLTGNNTGILNDGTTNISNVSIMDGITNNGELNFSGNNNITDLNSEGTVSNSGDLILTNANLQGSYTQTSGSLGVVGETNFSDSNTNISGGSFAIGDTTGNSASAAFNGTIGENAQLTVNSGSTFTNTGNVTLNNNDTLDGSFKQSTGTLNLKGATTNGNLSLDDGDVNITGDQTLTDGDNIGSNVDLTVDATLTNDGGTINLNNGDKIESTGSISQTSGVINADNFSTTESGGSLQASGGSLNISSGGLTLNNTNDNIAGGATVNMNGNLTINEGKVLLNEDDSWKSGIVSVSSNGKLQFENFEATSNSDTTLKMDGAGSVTELLSSTVTFGNAENISDGTIAIDYDSGILIQSGSYNLSDMKTSGSISTINGGYENHTADTMTILNNTTPSVISNNDIAGDGFAAFGVDLYARNANKLQNSDVFKGTDLTLSDTNGTGEVYIADYVLNGKLNRSDAPIDRYYNFKIFDYENIDPNITISATDKETFTPIGYYRLFSNGDGSYTLGLTRYNKQVFRTQATTLAQYNNQLAIDDMVTSHHTLFGERKLAHASYNRFASATPNLGPYQYSQQDGGLWFKSYADLERLSMTQDLNVHNTAYGAIIGADFPIVNLKGGWKFIPTPYIGYNGAHQSFNDVSAYQTGGQLGFMGTFMKNHFISSHTIYGGGYYNEMHVDNVLDNTGNWFWGTAHRFAYNWNIKNHFIIQPTAFISYNMFGEQNLHSDFGDMGMKSGMLNGINIAPGINFIYAERDWSAYIGVQYMYNINEQVSGRAGNVYLPNLAMRHGYIQYGIGGTKNINDDLAAYAQVMFRNAGRTGVAFQLGLQYYFDIHEIGSKIKNGYNITLNKIKNIKKEK